MRQTQEDMRNLAPIPTYEEAISRPSSSQRGPTEISDDAQRQRLYRQPTVESARNSEDSSLSVPDMVGEEHDERRQIEELDYMEPGEDENGRQYHRARLRNKISSRLSSLSARLRNPFRRRYAPVTAADPEEPAPVQPGWVQGWSPRLPDGYRMSVPVFARLFALFMIASFVYMLFAMDFLPGAFRRHHGMAATMFNPENVREFVLEHLDLDELSSYVNHMSSFAHEAGSEGNYILANWMEQKWQEVCELDSVEIDVNAISANYPNEGERWVKVVSYSPQGKDLSLEFEEDLSVDRPDRQQTPAWHGYSATGTVRGKLIFAGQGRADDIETAKKKGSLKDTIAIIDISGSTSDLEIAFAVKRAQEAGCAGLLVSNNDPLRSRSDKWVDASIPTNDTVHRANVVLSNYVIGDPKKHTGPGRPSIPSIPISWRNAEYIQSLLNDTEAGRFKGVDEVVVELRNENEEVDRQKIYSVVGRITGAENPKQKVIVGAPRDAWCFGASNSASASAMLTSLVAIFGELLKSGWRPLRTIEFVSWDARTFNSAGSTAYVEQTLDQIRENTIAYVNVESTFGENFYASGSPLLRHVLQRAMERIVAPGENETMWTMYGPVSDADPMKVVKLTGASGDYTPFAHIAAVPTLDFGWNGMPQDLVKGSCYDTSSRLDQFGDKGADYHRALVQTWAMVVLDLVSAPLLPLDARVFADELTDMVSTLNEETAGRIELVELTTAIADLSTNVTAFHSVETDWTLTVMGGGGLEDLYWHRKRNEFNEKITAFEKAFLDTPQKGDPADRVGLADRPQFKHMLYAPKIDSEGTQVLPTVWERALKSDPAAARAEITRLADMIRRAGQALVAE